MFLSELKLWNFRKFFNEASNIILDTPALHLHLQNGLNVIAGENNAGKTAIIDSIKYVLGTQSREYLRPDIDDFSINNNIRMNKLRIEIILCGLTEQEAGLFLDWLEFDNNPNSQYILRVFLTAEYNQDRVSYRIEAGPAQSGRMLDDTARDLLRATYLKPLRDADAELTPGRRSRLAQILSSHKVFSVPLDGTHSLESLFDNANKEVERYFSKDENGDGQEILTTINSYLNDFMDIAEPLESKLSISKNSLSDILHKLSLGYGDNQEGLGALNLLYIAVELLLLHEGAAGLHLGIIEELEAHLHPQAQLRLISFLENKTGNCQFILTTHSTTIGASIDLKRVIICRNKSAFSLAPEYTKLEPKHYEFLRRFLDATKANLFFANGLIFIEGDAENILLPTIAKIIDRPLEKYGVSIINIGSLAFAHYAKIFERKNTDEDIDMKIAIITDRDVRPQEYYEQHPPVAPTVAPSPQEIAQKIADKESCFADIISVNTKGFISPNWTLEYEIALSPFRRRLYRSILFAGKIQNSVSGYPAPIKAQEVINKRDQDFSCWKSSYARNQREKEKIAYHIFQENLVEKNISKAITAQVFVDFLWESTNKSPQRKAKIKNYILNAPTMKYLVDAIAHVTEPISED